VRIIFKESVKQKHQEKKQRDYREQHIKSAGSGVVTQFVLDKKRIGYAHLLVKTQNILVFAFDILSNFFPHT